MSGKGDQRRPCQVSKEQFERNWDKTFGHQSEGQSEDQKRVTPRRSEEARSTQSRSD
jgi:hypothetical protein